MEDDKAHTMIHQPANIHHETWILFLQMVLLVALCTASLATVALVVMPLH
jgi:hypothetical protein